MYASDHWHNSLSLSTLGRRLLSVPMLLVLPPLCLGILLAESFALHPAAIATTLVFALLIAWRTSPSRLSAVAIAIAITMLGWLAAMLGTNTSAVPYNSDVEMTIEITSPTRDMGEYSSADGCIVAWHDGTAWRDVEEVVRVWIEDVEVDYGDRVMLCGTLRPHISRHADYDELLYRRNYAGGVSIGTYNTLHISHNDPSGLQAYAIGKLSRYATDDTSHATLEAMVAGTRHAMPQSLRDAYSRTGLAHLMAVSGLHLGIVLIAINILLLPLRLIHRGHRVANILAIVALWLFVGVCGASASVVRAALMLSVLQLSLLSSSRYNSLNALAATLFVMLLYRTDYLFDISFQLSALAVAGIILWGVPLLRTLPQQQGIWRALLTTLFMGVVATLWTMPLVSHTFGHIALIGILATPLAMLCAYVIVSFGILTLILPHPLSLPFGYVAEWAAYAQNSIACSLNDWGITGFTYRMSGMAVAICYTLFIAITAVIWSINRKKVITL